MTKEAHDRKDHGTWVLWFAFASIVLTCFGSYFFVNRFFQPAEMVPVSFALGAAYVAIGILANDFLCHRLNPPFLWYYSVQCALLTALIFLSPARGFFGLLVLPVASQSVFDLRPRHTCLVVAYLFLVCIGVWGMDYGWRGMREAIFNYSSGFVFTIAFTLVTKQAVKAREREEKLRQEVEAANEQLRAHAVQAEDLATTRERNRVAREIHDGVGHYLTVVKTQLDAAAAILPTQPDQALAAITKAARLTGDALDDVRRSVGTLRTDAARPPLPEALRQLAAHGEPIPTLTVEGDPRPLPAGVEHALYRAAQEGLTNIHKHARATCTLVRLDFRTPQRVVLELADNGVGTAAGPDGPGFGLRGLRERVELLGGTVDTGNRLEGGFALRVEIPA